LASMKQKRLIKVEFVAKLDIEVDLIGKSG
jgi:hypothetical protein